MSGPAALRFCARALERDAGFHGTFLAPPGTRRLQGALFSARVPSDLQRHDVGPGGEVLHLSSLGVRLAPAAARGPAADADGEAAAGAAGSRGAAPRLARGGQRSAGAGAEGEPWAAALYARGQTPGAGKGLLAAQLRCPQGWLRGTGALQMPGVSVQMVTFPKGLPPEARGLLQPGGALSSGRLPGAEPLVAVGEASLRTPGRASGALPAAGPRAAAGRAWRCEGHRYTVVVRGLDARACDDGSAEAAVERLCRDGFLNLFELSSFGHAEVRRYEVGAALWSGSWDLAARLLLSANCGEGSLPSARAARAFRAGDLVAGVDLLPEDGAEGLRALAMQLLCQRPALEALQQAVPPSVWARHLVAVSKLAWNHAAAARFADKPRRPIAGDLIWDDVVGEVRPLSASEAAGRHLSDVLVPLPRPGGAVPECPGRLALEKTLRGLVPGPEVPESELPFRGFPMPRHRPLVVVPGDPGCDILDADGGPVVECDLERLGAEVPKGGRAGDLAGGRGRRSGGAARAARGPVLRLRVSLPRACSAEALLRELLLAEPSEFRAGGIGRRDELF